MEREVAQPYYEDDYQSLDEMSTIDLLEMKDSALEELNEREHIIHRINQILDSRIECDCDLIDGPHFVKKCAGKKGGRISKRK